MCCTAVSCLGVAALAGRGGWVITMLFTLIHQGHKQVTHDVEALQHMQCREFLGICRHHSCSWWWFTEPPRSSIGCYHVLFSSFLHHFTSTLLSVEQAPDMPQTPVLSALLVPPFMFPQHLVRTDLAPQPCYSTPRPPSRTAPAGPSALCRVVQA